MSDVGRAIAGWALLESLAKDKYSIARAIAELERPTTAVDAQRAQAMNLYPVEWERVRADLAKLLGTLRGGR